MLKGTAIMTAQEIRTQGRLVKSWEVSDGPWYTYYHQIWEVGDKYYRITDYKGTYNSLGCTMSRYGEVTEVEKPEPLPTHMGIILGVKKGDAWVEDKFQGTPDQIAEWYDARLNILQSDYYKRRNRYFLKVVELSFD